MCPIFKPKLIFTSSDQIRCTKLRRILRLFRVSCLSKSESFASDLPSIKQRTKLFERLLSIILTYAVMSLISRLYNTCNRHIMEFFFFFQTIRSIRNLLTRRGLYTESIRKVCESISSSGHRIMIPLLTLSTFGLLMRIYWMLRKFYWPQLRAALQIWIRESSPIK